MSKSVYSMVLSDEVIRLIDNAALKTGKSRSTLVNEILASYVGYSTSGRRIEEILSLVTEAFEQHGRMRVERRQQSTIDFLSAINYKYNPRVTYSVELFTEDEFSGYLKIALRTTSQALITVINEFFNAFIAIEHKYLGDVEYSVVDGKLVRKLRFKEKCGTAEIALKITDYVNVIDKLINGFIEDYFVGTAEENLHYNYLKIKDNIDF